jgi:hypothetical protein
LDIASATSRCALGPGSACGRACALCAACPALCPGSTCGKRCSLSAVCPARCPGSACGKRCSLKPNGGAVLCLHVPLPPKHPNPPFAVLRPGAQCGKGCSLSLSSSRTIVLGDREPPPKRNADRGPSFLFKGVESPEAIEVADSSTNMQSPGRSLWDRAPPKGGWSSNGPGPCPSFERERCACALDTGLPQKKAPEPIEGQGCPLVPVFEECARVYTVFVL